MISLGGRTFSLKGRTLEFYALVEAEIVKLRGNPLTLVVEAAKSLKGEPNAPQMLDMVANAVSERFRNWRMTTYRDHAEFFETPYGDAFQIWCCIKHADPSLTPDQVRLWLMEAIASPEGANKRDEIMAAINRASSEDQLGNLTGPSPTTNPTAG